MVASTCLSLGRKRRFWSDYFGVPLLCEAACDRRANHRSIKLFALGSFHYASILVFHASSQAEEAQLLKQLPAEELALAEEQRQLQRMTPNATGRAAAGTTAAYPPTASPAQGTIAAVVGTTGVTDSRGHEHPWGPEKLWSDSESEFGGESMQRVGPQSVSSLVDADAMGETVDGRGGSEGEVESEGEGEVDGGGGSVGKEGAGGTLSEAVNTKVGAGAPDALAELEYVDVESAEAPALADWIASGAAEACEAVEAASEASLSLPNWDVDEGISGQGRGHHDRGSTATTAAAIAVTASIHAQGVDDNSFCSEDYDEKEGRDMSDADSEARLIALVAKVAIRGRESRSALIVQALVRGRAARKSAAAIRGRACAEEEAVSAAAEQKSTLSTLNQLASDRGEGVSEAGALEDLEWLTRREREDVLSNSFGSGSGSEYGGAAAASVSYGTVLFH